MASLQCAVSSEEQARAESGSQMQRQVDLVHDEVAAEAKERRAQGASLAEDIALLQRGLRQRDDRAEALAGQINEEMNDIRERVVKEIRLREAGAAQIEQKI